MNIKYFVYAIRNIYDLKLIMLKTAYKSISVKPLSACYPCSRFEDFMRKNNYKRTLKVMECRCSAHAKLL